MDNDAAGGGEWSVARGHGHAESPSSGASDSALLKALTAAVENRLRYWEDELAKAALDDDNDRAVLCEQFIREYTPLVEVGSSSDAAAREAAEASCQAHQVSGSVRQS
jgi:hypothetical protein